MPVIDIRLQLQSASMADHAVEKIDSLPADYEEVERGIARVRFSEGASEDDVTETSYAADESEMITDDDDTVFKSSRSASIPAVLPSNDDGQKVPVSSFSKSATLAAVLDYTESSDDSVKPAETLGAKSKSSPDMIDHAALKSEVDKLDKLLSTHMDVTCVLDRLYLSDFISLSAERLSELGVSLVINATYEIPNIDVPEGTVEFIKLNINDSIMSDMSQHMDVCADRIHEVRSAGGVALVHCALGISRSVTICLAYLVKYEGRTLREAYFELKKIRPIIRPNEGFWRQLIAFETAKRGRPTVKLSVYPMGVIPDVYRGAPQTVKTRRYQRFF